MSGVNNAVIHLVCATVPAALIRLAAFCMRRLSPVFTDTSANNNDSDATWENRDKNVDVTEISIIINLFHYHGLISGQSVQREQTNSIISKDTIVSDRRKRVTSILVFEHILLVS